MNLFKASKKENHIIKLFKITDLQSAKQFDMESCILNTIAFINQKTDLQATCFDLNYKDSRKTLNGFKKILKKQKEIVYSSVGFEPNNTNTYFSISNPMLNYTEPPQNSILQICIQISSELIDQKSVENIAETLINAFNFEYGYITKLPENYDSETERKIKRGLFSTSVEVNETDHVWTFHSIGILEGYIKSLYQLNYLNKSHFEDSNFKERSMKYGTLQSVSNKISKWTLNLKEIRDLKKDRHIKNKSIITEDLEFLKTDEAKVFKDKMEPKNNNF
ncbi:hypothetical protein M0D21_02470 [Aquimarina sp. D1M17]|uniref:hypothetical protein n=1 Tax=Aquimarina acroporae TaxID=2937283 RepID=UPI0020C17015|nr:hypothetical protein [Aquimarina acroporae]MCK8520412.1 hypothetical protein [Aquimarina acroporae]